MKKFNKDQDKIIWTEEGALKKGTEQKGARLF